MARFPVNAKSSILSAATSLLLLTTAVEPAAAVTCPTNGEYDFIVVGGGTAGLAVASRLSSGLPDKCILVLEAGVDAENEPKINIPGLKGSTLSTTYDWNLTTVPQPNANNRVWAQARGRVLGGSSALNLMTWDRASTYEYDTWEKKLGLTGWNWNTFIRAMLKVETFFPSSNYGSTGVGSTGPIQSLVNRFIPAQQETWIPTMNNLGIASNLESLGGNPLGVMYQPSNIRNSDYRRSYSAYNPGYPSVAIDNLEIKTSVRVAKINLVKYHGKLASTGVTLTDGTVFNASAEVIVSAGAFQSPQLLEVSGIGGKSVLTAAGIPVLYDLPGVGENLQDHIRIQSSYQLLDNYTSFDILRHNATYAAEQMALYNQNEVSLYDYTGSGYSFMTWKQALGNDTTLRSLAVTASTKNLTNSPFEPIRKKILLDYLTNKAVPQVEVIFSDGYTGVKGYPAVGNPLRGIGTFSLIASIQHPFSVGSVHATSANISVNPSINPNYFAQEYDLQATIFTAKYLRKIANTYPMKQIWSAEYEPGTTVVPEGDDAAWKNYVLNNALTIFHPAGTCAMNSEALHGVVNKNLKVHGTHNLRVVDASVIPVLMGAHIQTAVYGIAEIAAEKIIEEWGC
ncbi:putative glucose-methanol-choline oxidoreductase [Bisporella sp. PMI_857]|nr:putative glucose-methanol-choline oxidoreductase [Bisporella sp. PMI_857]